MSKIKICGLFNDCDIDFVNEAKPDYIGFVFAKSRRQVTFEKAKQMRSRLDLSITPVGVFVDAPIEEIVQLFQDGVINIVQLHGHEDESYIDILKQKYKIPVIKTVRVNSAQDITNAQFSNADYLLFDNGAGGTGKAFDWKLIPDIKKQYFLAGGVNMNNIVAALSQKSYCIDISSGAETNGIKDKEKILQLVNRVREIE